MECLRVVVDVTVVIMSVMVVVPLNYSGGAVVIISVSSKAWLMLLAVTVT